MTYRDEYGQTTGRVDEDGTIRDEYGQAIGRSIVTVRLEMSVGNQLEE